MDLSLIYNDPAHQMLARRMGMDMQAYVANMDPRSLEINIQNLSRGSAVYNTQEQVNNLRRVGANSGPNAFIPEAGSPMTEGMLSSPVQPQAPIMDPGALNIPSASSPVQARGTPAALTQPGQGGSLPEHGDSAADAVLTSDGTGATPGALTSGGNTPAATAARPNSGPSSGARQTPTNNTGNARQSGMPDMRIGRMAQLGRIGTAMLGSAGDGLLASMSAGGDAMYAVNDENRAAEMAEYENSERLRLEEAQRRAAAARGGSGGGSGGATNVAGGGIYQRATLTALDAIQGYIDRDNGSSNPYNNINGFTGNWLAARPGTPAHDVAGLLRTVEGAIGFDRLDAMRRASRTGGALGAISERELALLSSSLASLRQSASAAEFQRNITLVRNHYQSAVAALNAQLAADAGLAPAPSGQAPAPTAAAPTAAFNPDDYTVVEVQ